MSQEIALTVRNFLQDDLSPTVTHLLGDLVSNMAVPHPRPSAATTVPPSASPSNNVFKRVSSFAVPVSYLSTLGYILGNPSSAVSFRSQEQIEMVRLVTEAHMHGLFVLPTGAGKTMAVLFPVLHEHLEGINGVSIVVMPFVSLAVDVLRRARKVFRPLGIEFATWPRDFKGPDGADMNAIKLVFMQVESIITDAAAEFMRRLKAQGRLKRIIVDEVHQLLIACDYRDCFRSLPDIVSFGVPIFGLSATLPPRSEAAYVLAMHLKGSVVQRIRSPRSLPLSIRYEVTRLSCLDNVTDKLAMDVSSGADGLLESDTDRGIVFVNSKRSGELYASCLKLPFYSSATEKKEDVLRGWFAGDSGAWIVATYALSHGVDYPHVRCVIHASPPSGLLEYLQESGRAGRDGRMALCRMYVSDRDLNHHWPVSGEDHEGFAAMKTFLTGLSECRRTHLTNFLDGHESSCAGSPNAVLCDICDAALCVSGLLILICKIV